MTTHRRRATTPRVLGLEARTLLSLSAQWIGQDAHDLVGPSSTPGGDGVQDIHIALGGLPAGRTVAHADLQGLGGGDWQFNGPYGPWAAALVRAAGATTGDLYADPSDRETGRPFQVSVRYDDGSQDSAWFAGGVADPNLRMPSASARLAWIGQDGHDRVGPGAAVGPDGVQDVHLALANLSPGVPITDVTVASSGGSAWDFGLNPSGFAVAAFDRDGSDSSKGDLYLNPPRDPAGQTITATITYANGKIDHASVLAGHASPTLVQPPTAGPMPNLIGVAAAWVGQDGQDLAGPGSARIRVGNLPPGRSIVAAAVSDAGRDSWAYRRDGGVSFYADPYAGALGFRADPTGADLAFAPGRDEAGSTLTVRLLLDDGTSAVATVVAGATDPGLRAPGIAATSVVAHPGDDLNDLANRFGTVRLSAGVYAMGRPLVLNQPVTILADPGATIRFSQAANDPAWSSAIKIRAGHTTLDGFSVRFASPIRWADDVSYGPAVIGTSDNLDPPGGSTIVALTISRLDLESPPVPSGNVEAPRLIRLASALGGTIAGNTLKGGTTEFLGGPWTISGNAYLGTVPNTYCWAAFAGHNTHDVVLTGNTAQPVGASGRTWRFLVLTNSGFNDDIANNTVVGIGPRDGDAQDANAAEIILTESYSLHFEGSPSAISADGRVLQIPTPQGGAGQTGDVVAILSGPYAGQYRRIAQAIGPQTYLMETPLPSGPYAISIASGFVGETFRGNTIDARGSSAAGDLILAGNHFGTRVVGNHFLGGADGFRLTAAPSEHPDVWGWSHAPFLGATIDGNTIEDAARGATVSVEHSPAIQGDAGRVYFSGSLTNNVVAWSASFLASHNGGSGVPGLVVGQAGSIDPGELLLTTAGNTGSVGPGAANPSLSVVAGTVDGQAARDRSIPLAAPSLSAPTGLGLVNDTGFSASDRITTDGRLAFRPVAGAVGYEYQVSNDAGYLPVPSPSGFLPRGLTENQNTIWVRAIDARGRRGPTSEYAFFLRNAPPITSIPFLAPADDTGLSATDRITRDASPGFNVTGDVGDTILLLRDGQEVARRLGPGPLADPSALPSGTYGYSLHRVDAAGNPSDSATVALVIDTTPPPAVPSLAASENGVISFAATAADDSYQYRVGASGTFVNAGRATSFSAMGLAPGANAIGVRAVDVAGNVGPESWVNLFVGAAPTGRWLGQDGHDLAGPDSSGSPDGIQDIHVVLNGLRPDRAIAFLDVQGLGGSDWQFGGPYGPWKSSLVRQAGSSTADLYLQPDRVETGRAFAVTIVYDDGTRSSFWVSGGRADPALKMPPVASQATIPSANPAAPFAKKAAAHAKAPKKAAHPHAHPAPKAKARAMPHPKAHLARKATARHPKAR